MNNTLEKTKPTNSIQLISFKKDVEAYAKKVDGLVINNALDNEVAAALITKIKSRFKDADNERKERTKPLDALKKQLMADYRPITDAFNKLERVVKQKTIAYDDQIQAENRRIQLQNEKKMQKYNKKIEEGKAPAYVPVIKSEVENTTTGQSFVSVTKWDLVDLSKVPREYLILDEKKISGAVKIGLEIPGIKTRVEKQQRNRL